MTYQRHIATKSPSWPFQREGKMVWTSKIWASKLLGSRKLNDSGADNTGGKGTDIGHFQYARHSAKPFIGVRSFNPYDNVWRKIFVFALFCKWINTVFKVKELVQGYLVRKQNSCRVRTDLHNLGGGERHQGLRRKRSTSRPVSPVSCGLVYFGTLSVEHILHCSLFYAET